MNSHVSDAVLYQMRGAELEDRSQGAKENVFNVRNIFYLLLFTCKPTTVLRHKTISIVSKKYNFIPFEVSINIFYRSESRRIFSGPLVGFRRTPEEPQTD